VNAAGWDRIEPFVNNTPEFMNKVMQINLMGPIILTQALLPTMIQEGSGKIVNVASDAGRVGSMGETVYAAAKGGMIAFTKSLAREMARYQIHVNCVCPGPTDTPLFHAQPDKLKEALIKAIPFKRLAMPEETASAILFFASEDSNYVTAQIMSVSGGLTMVG
jgi:2-hydroxycyclohexanecarboxyl-CoA dehydrogenase